MNKIVRERYPVENLPEDLRAELGLVSTVTVTIEAEPKRHDEAKRAAAIAELLEHRRRLPPSTESSVLTVRRLRDEWDQ
jgi:hypothetical protein